MLQMLLDSIGVTEKRYDPIIGAVNLMMKHLFVMVIGKQIQPIPYMIWFAIRYFTWKVIIKTFNLIYDILHCSFNYASQARERFLA